MSSRLMLSVYSSAWCSSSVRGTTGVVITVVMVLLSDGHPSSLTARRTLVARVGVVCGRGLAVGRLWMTPASRGTEAGCWPCP